MLTKIDGLIFPDHYRLDGQDLCYFIGEYTAGRGYEHSATNQLILNLKKSVDRLGKPEYWYKGRAIRQAARDLADSLDPEFLRDATFVPVPPSYAKDHALYDDRICQVIRQMGPAIDLRELVIQIQTRPGAHLCAHHPSTEELYANYMIDNELLEPKPAIIAVVDDVLTTGAHFKAMERILSEPYPNTSVVGIFLARRVPNTELFEGEG